jgi:hypothetical protein
MDRTPVSSSNIASAGYDVVSMTLEVEFHSGYTYQYFDVPEAVFGEFIVASSPGSYHNQHIKGNYRYARL